MSIKIDRHKINKLISSYLNGNIDKFRELIKSGENVNCIDEKGRSLIFIVIYNSGVDPRAKSFFDELIVAGVHLGKIGNEPGLCSAAISRQNDTYYLKKLLENNIDVNFSGYSRWDSTTFGPPIFDAIIYQQHDHLNLLLKHNPDLELCDDINRPILSFLLDKAKYASRTFDEYGEREDNPINKKYISLFNQLILCGADVNAGCSYSIRPIHQLMTKTEENLDLLNSLFSSKIKVEINAKDGDGDTALFMSIKEGLPCACNFLISKGASLDILNVEGHSALAIAAIYNEPEIFDILEKAGADFCLVDKNGNNIMHHLANFSACGYNFYERILSKSPQLLLMKNKNKETFIDVMKKNKNKNYNSKNKAMFKKLLKKHDFAMDL